MRRMLVLADLEALFVKQLLRLRYDVHQARKLETSREIESRMTFAAINLLTAWSNFVKAFYLSCAFGTTTKSGISVRSAITFPESNSAIGFAIQQFRKYAVPNTLGIWNRRDEPTWHDPKTILTLANVLKLQNESKIQAAFSINIRVLVDLPVVRNFYAHRNQGTMEAAQKVAPQYGISSYLRATQLLFAYPIKRPQQLIFEWLDELQISADYLCD